MRPVAVNEVVRLTNVPDGVSSMTNGTALISKYACVKPRTSCPPTVADPKGSFREKLPETSTGPAKKPLSGALALPAPDTVNSLVVKVKDAELGSEDAGPR